MRLLPATAAAFLGVVALAVAGQDPDEPALSCIAKEVPARIDGTPGADVLASDPAVIQRVRGFGGNDTLTAAGPRDCLHGGAGDDRLVAAPEGSLLRGGHETDRLVGGDGKDELRGDQGKDVLEGGAGDDDLDGALVSHIVVRGTHLSGVPYEQEPDVLLGGAGNDQILAAFGDIADGGPGDDEILDHGWARRLAGGDGNDRIMAIGSDAIDAGAGDDRIVAQDESANARKDGMQTIDCGPGRDRVEANFTDELRGCESVKLLSPGARLSVRPRRGGRRTTFRLSFRAPRTDTEFGRRFLAVDGRAPSLRCSHRGRRVAAPRPRTRVRVTLAPPRRGWCDGPLSLILFETGRRPGEDFDESYSVAIARVRIAGGR